MPNASELSAELCRHGPRPAGSDAERRAAGWVAAQVPRTPRRHTRVETFWLRPGWAGAQSVHVLLAVGGSLLSSTHARLGAAVLALALLAMLADWRFGRSPGRLLMRERASQNVVSISTRERRVRLIITANLDTTRLDPDWTLALPGWLFWVVAATVWALLSALARVEGSHSTATAVLQIIPTVALILAAAGLLLGSAPSDNAGGVAAALALTRLLDAAPPEHLAVDLIVTGAGAGYGHGLRRHLAAERRRLKITNTVVLGLSGVPGAPGAHLVSDGPLVAVSFFGRLRQLGADTGQLVASSGRGCSPALPGRLRRLPALGLRGDPDLITAAAVDLVDRIDAYVGALAAETRL